MTFYIEQNFDHDCVPSRASFFFFFKNLEKVFGIRVISAYNNHEILIE